MGLFGIGVYQPVGNDQNLLYPQPGVTLNPPSTGTTQTIAIVTKGKFTTGIGTIHPFPIRPIPGIPGVTTFFYETAVLANSTVVYYPLADLSTTEIYDASGNGQTASIPVSAISGVTEGGPAALACTGEATLPSMTFNGNSGSITLPSSFDPTTFPAFSVVLWVNPQTLSGNPRLIANSHTNIDKHGFQVYLQSSNNQAGFTVGTGSAVGTVTSSATVPQGTWTQIAATWNPTSGNLLIYINGIQQAPVTFTGNMSAPSYPVMLARDPAYGTDFYHGGMAHVSFHNTELSPEVISNLYLLGINQGATLIGNGWSSDPGQSLPPFSGIYGGNYGYVLDTTIRAPKYVQYIPAQSIGNDALGNPVVRSYPQMQWQYSSLRPDYWFYLKNLYKLAGQAPVGYQYLVLLQYPDQSGNNTPIQTLARWEPPTQGQRQVGAYYNVQLTFTYLGQAELSAGTQVVVLQ